MKPTELRIGNWIADSNGNPCKVTTILEHLISVNGQSASAHVFQPIPLTPELLVKCGFELITWNDVIRQYYIQVTKSGHCVLSFRFGEYRGFPDRLDQVTIGTDPGYSGNTYGSFDIKHLHQLQNLYFALTGEELNCNF